MKKKVLIIGNSAKEYALAKKMSEKCEVFVAPGNDGMKEFSTCVDIRETSAQELLEFAMENGIDMTIPISLTSLNTDIVNLFSKNNMQIFAPGKSVSEILYDKFSAKKVMYKLGIPTPKFGIFEKQTAANDYIKNMKTPFVIKNSAPSSAVVITSLQTSKSILDAMFTEKYPKVLLEEYVYGTPFGFYVITDGYNAIPIGSSLLYKYSLEGGGGQLTSGMGACSPNYKLSFQDEEFLMNDVIYPALDYLERNRAAYPGVLGVNGILCDDGSIKILSFQPFMQDADCAGILALLETDIYNLFESCIIGSFSDEISYIEQKNAAAVSVVLYCKNTDNKENVIENSETDDDNIIISYTNNVCQNKYLEIEAKTGAIMVVTAVTGTHASSYKKVYDVISDIKFNGIKYRHDICKIADNYAEAY